MAIYSIDNTVAAGRPCKIFDAHGNELCYVTLCDTVSGEVEQLCQDENGTFRTSVNGKEIFRKLTIYPAPLRVEFMTTS